MHAALEAVAPIAPKANLIDQFYELPKADLKAAAEAMYARLGSSVSPQDWALIVALTDRIGERPAQ